MLGLESQLVEAALRETVVRALFFLPAERRKRIERWLRGREEFRRLREADVAFVSWGKSGRTWLRLMLSRFYQQRFGLPEGSFLEFDNLHRREPAIPRVFFTHGNYLRDYTGHWESREDFRGTRVLLLVRDPRDVAVSQFFQWKHRMLARKKFINDYPPEGADVPLRDFVMEHDAGLARVIEFMNLWARELAQRDDLLVVRYEDLRADPEAKLAEILTFLGTPPEPGEVKEAVEYASVENMRQLERAGSVRATGQRLVPGRRDDPDSYKVRRAVVGGWRDYFDDADQARIDAWVGERLDPVYGYGPDPRGAGPAADAKGGEACETD